MERDDTIREIWGKYYDVDTGQTRCEAMARELTQLGIKTSRGTEFTGKNLWQYLKRSPNRFPQPTRTGAVAATAGQPPREDKQAPELVFDMRTQAVSSTAHLPSPQLIGSISRLGEGERPFALILSQQDCDAVFDMLDWFRSRPANYRSVFKQFPETLPSYEGKQKDSLKLIPHRWKLGQERAKALWPRQQVNKSDLAQWLLEMFLQATEDQTVEIHED